MESPISFYDVMVRGITGKEAEATIRIFNDAIKPDKIRIQYWWKTKWVDVRARAVKGSTHGKIPVRFLRGTPIAIGT